VYIASYSDVETAPAAFSRHRYHNQYIS